MDVPRYAWVQVDLRAIEHNVRALKGLTRPGTLFMAVVKADAYGHGGVPVARRALDAGADRLGVATVAEAIELREAGITARLHVLSEPPAAAAGLLLDHDIIATVATRDFAVALAREATARGTEALYHLKVDSGMNRVGVRAEDAAEFSAGLKDFPGLEHEGTFTHFATADTPGDWDFETQMQRFTSALHQMRDEGVDPGIVHAANSPATILHSESHFSMVRCGIALYGLHPDPATRGKVELRPAMSVRARISFLKRIAMGEGVSYGLTWRAASPTTIATLPLGYADGVHRVLSNKMDVLIGGRRCHQVGRVCMDQLMVEVPAGLAARVGDEVVVVGSDASETIAIEEMADLAGTINYEIACAFGMRMERIYI